MAKGSNKTIDSFSGDYRFLSNFYPAEVELDELNYPSTEHAYQAAKTTDAAQRRKIREAPKPGDAKKLGQRVDMRKDWEKVKIQVMHDLVKQKFTKHQDLKEKLLETGNATLVEGNTWGDKFWGKVKGSGKNHLGKILMQVRDELNTT